MSRHWPGKIALCLLLTAAAASCSKQHDTNQVVNPMDPAVTGITPPLPVRLRAEVGERGVTLSWVLQDSSHASAVRRYRIYQRTGAEADPVLADSTDRPPTPVADLNNGTTYRLSVSSVLANGLEGNRSEEVIVVPGTYSVQIEGGRRRVNSPQVVLTLLGPDGTRGVEIGNSADLSGAAAQPFVATASWQLLPGDGPKTVYARFIDPQGNTSELVSDETILDTRAEILDISFAPLSAAPGDRIHFSLDAGEADGTAQVQLGSGGRRLTLRDDGTGGDATAGDGVYELDYVAEDDLDIIDALVTGAFTDEAGNTAPARVAMAHLTVHRDLPAVTLDPILSPGPRELFLAWSQATDTGRFSSYRIFRAEAAGVDTSRTRRQVAEVSTRTSTTWNDSNLEPDHAYYYRVYVVDRSGQMVSSNERSGRTRLNPAPDPVVLYTPSEVTENSVFLSFSQSNSPEFSGYRIYRGLLPDLDHDPDRKLLTTVGGAASTTWRDQDEVQEGTTYYYRVDVVDNLGSASPSNVVSATTLDKPPRPVDLNSPSAVGETSVLLTWPQSDALDFDRYELRRSTQAGVGPEAPLLTIISTKEVTDYLDQGLDDNTAYYYRLFVADKGGNVTGGREQTVTTRNADPPPVSLDAPTQTDTVRTTIGLHWSISTVHDFQEYRIYRDTAPAVGEDNATLIRVIADSATVSFLDEHNLVDNTRYYYRVFVHDTASNPGISGSNEQSILTRNLAPTPVTLQEPTTTSSSIRLQWSQNNDSDFHGYQILQWVSDPGSATVVQTFTHREQTSHTIAVSEHDPTRYYFRIRVTDDGQDTNPNRSSDSNTVTAKAQ